MRDALSGESRIRDAAGPVARVLIAGDLFLPQVDGYSPHPWQGLIAAIAEHDLSVVNIECALSQSSVRIVKSGPAMVAPPALAGVARAGGFGVASLANNHVRDAGAEGLLDTLRACRGAGLEVVGAGATLAEAQAPLFRETPAGRLAVLAFAEREFSIAGTDSPGAAPLDPWSTSASIARLRRDGDIVVVVVHGGNEMASHPRPGLVRTCRALVDAGAHAVVCHHTHVPGGEEVYCDAPIVYGTGNFLFPLETRQPPGWYRGYLVSLTLDRRGAVSSHTIPYIQETRPLRVSRLSAREAERFREEIARISAVIADGDSLEQTWRHYCCRERRYALGALLGLTRPERALMRLGVWPRWRRSRRSLPALYDLLSCDSHRELVETILEAEMDLETHSPSNRPFGESEAS